jgi:hypothetical protein
MTVATDKIRVSTYLDPSLKKQAEKLAKSQKRSFSNLLEVLLEEAVTQAIEKGVIGDDPKNTP